MRPVLCSCSACGAQVKAKGKATAKRCQSCYLAWLRLNPPNKGRIFSIEWRDKIGKASLGRSVSIEARKKRSDFQTGRTRSRETREKMSLGKLGNKNPAWSGGISGYENPLRHRQAHNRWRIAVKDRDGWMCIWCGTTNNLHVDHILPLGLFPNKALDLDNGRTLCHSCHKTTPSYGRAIKYQTLEITNA